MKKLLLFAIVILGFSAVSFGQQSSSQISTVGATAKIIAPIQLSKGNDLAFGAIAKSIAGGEVELKVDNSRVATGVTLGINTGVQAATFTVVGEANSTYYITLPADGAITLTSTALGAQSMELKTWTENATETLLLGTETFKVGATLVVPANQVPGNYTGEFPVTVTYN